jgi:hypothetical protein
MNYQFETLTNVFFKHSYFSDTKFEGLTVKAADSAIYMMTSQGLLFKSIKGGFQILFNTDFAGRKREREEVLKDTFTLTFHLLLNTPSFYNYTANISHNITQSVFYFSNISRNPKVALSPGRLHRENSVSGKDTYPADQFYGRFFSKPFGLLDLQINKGMEKTYIINFLAKSTFWRYILVSDHFRELHKPAILNPGNHEIFDGPNELTLPDGRPALAFTSKNKISLSEFIPLPFQLVENYGSGTGKHKVVITALPLPDVNTISTVEATPQSKTKTAFSEIFIY